MDYARAVDQVISQHLIELRKPGVLSVRPGYQAAGGWLTTKPAIVVNVDRKQDDLPAQDRLPETIGGFPVDVREASTLHRLRASNPTLYTSVAAAAPPELERPTFPYERDLSGQSMAPIAAAVAAARAPSKPEIDYTAPANSPLDPIDDQVTITCHASPDAGWPTLKTFLDGTKTRLTVGMYDFTSAHILETVKSALEGKKLNLVLDHPPPNKTRDQTDEDTVRALQDALGGELAFAWALERADPKAAQWIYPNAYHIKVAVRDGSVFWLSSGNWNNSNQPEIDPVNDPAGASSIAKSSDRDWHVIVQHQGLASLYEKYLQNDLKVASANQAGAAGFAASLDAFAALAEPALTIAARAPQQYFAPVTITGKMKIQPILTPDNYINSILPLINSATKSFYMQTQYIHPSDKQGDEGLAALIEAVAQKIKRGLDVRLIMSQYETLDKLELLQGAGIDLSHVRIQANVHNKGMIIDSETVALGSQNWSADGVIRNRDASLIIYNEEAAGYWNQIFVHDWANMASQHAAD
jgi:phosphatidylserine/phosphatidylglycerophosphate/cardiolipin synthase-like enzyme